MSLWKYVIKTSWNQKKADWAEFNALCQQMTDAENAVRAARDRISVICFEKAEQKTACITHVMRNGKMLEMGTVYCPAFYKADNVRGCYKFDCEYACKNREFHNACNRADELRAVQLAFWKNKFAHTK